MSENESQSAIFSYKQVISEDMIDVNGHVNNVAYVRWMQDAAVAHSRDSLQRGTVQQMGCTWVARSHHIEYLSPSFLDDDVEVRTWLASIRRVRCCRRYEFVRTSDDKLLAKGETDWVFVNIESGRPVSIPEEIASAFVLLPD
jgi:acyl-CoA thioester hydrolase